MNRIRRSLRTAALAGAAWAATNAMASSPIDAELSAAWWQWAVSIPNPQSPIFDTSGASCMVGQKGHLWFLAGTSGSTVTRTCSIPEGDAIFFPLINSVSFDSPGICGQTGRLSVPELRAYSAASIDGVTSYSATLDGVPLSTIRRIRSVVFPLALPPDNFFNAPPNCVVPGVVYSRSVDDGYYASILSLKPGRHVLHFAAAAGSFSLDVTYNLDVVRADKARR